MAGSVPAGLTLIDDDLPEGLSLDEQPEGRGFQYYLDRLNRGIVHGAGLPMDAVTGYRNLVDRANLSARGLNYAEERPEPLFNNTPGGSRWIMNQLQRDAPAVGPTLHSDEYAVPRTAAERYGGQAAEFAGAGMVPAGGIAGVTGRGAGFLAADAALGASQGAVFEGTRDATGSDTTAIAAAMAVPVAPAAASAGARRVLGGGPQNMRAALDDAAQVPGYTPSAGEAGGGFLTRWMERLGQYSLGSSGKVEAHMAGVDDALRRGVDDLAGRVEEAAQVARGSMINAEAAGIAIRKGLADDTSAWITRSRRAAQNADRTAAQAIEAAEQATGRPVRVSIKSVLDDIGAQANRQAEARGVLDVIGDPEAAAFARALQDTADDAGTISFQAAREIRAAVGNMTNWSGAAPNRDTAMWRRVYGRLSEEIGASVNGLPTVAVGNRRVNPGQAFTKGQRLWNRHFEQVEHFFDPVMARSAEPDKLASWVVNVAGKGSPVRIRQIRGMLRENRWNQVRAHIMRQMGRAQPSRVEGVLDAGEEAFSPLTFATNWNRMRQNGTLDAVFAGGSKNARWTQLRREWDTLSRVIGRVQRSRNAIANTSGTANRLIAHQQLTTAGGAAAASVLTGNPTILGTILAAQGSIAIGARAMMNPRVVKWMAQAERIPVERMPQALARLKAIAKEERDEETRAEIHSFYEQLRNLE